MRHAGYALLGLVVVLASPLLLVGFGLWAAGRFAAQVIAAQRDHLRRTRDDPETAPAGPEGRGLVEPDPAQWEAIATCPRCRGSHPALKFRPLVMPQGHLTHWAICPDTRQVIKIGIVEGTGDPLRDARVPWPQ